MDALTPTRLAASATVATAKHAWPRLLRLGTWEPALLDLSTPDDDRRGLTASDIADINSFMSSPQTRPLLSLAASILVVADNSATEELETELESAFRAQCKRWCIESRRSWHQASESLWAQILDVYRGALPQVENDQVLRNQFHEYSNFIRKGFSTKDAKVTFAQRLTDLAANMDRISRVLEIRDRLIESTRATSPGQMITYRDTGISTDFDRLYVNRRIYDLDETSSYEVEDVTERPTGYRIVILGAPGAGKSTLVRNLCLTLGEENKPLPQATVVVKCRDYFKPGTTTSDSESLTEHCASRLKSTYEQHVSTHEMIDLLTLGQLTVIFDGTDEVVQLNHRSELMHRIERFASEYPATSIVVTAREIGYHSAELPAGAFEHYRLTEFTSDQAEEYQRRWFDLKGRAELGDSFLEESNSIRDLRRNPLLLSLLCLLYESRGSIPRKRLDIYARCADLLFHTWDSHRQISQPEELGTKGDRIMQEIAHWIYTHESAQSGLEERVITKSIGNFLSDTSGIEESEARRRAASFLDFCAGRAWLLANLGTTDAGERLFGFTHRTFLEYFAAESIARRSRDESEVANRVVDAYKRDETSVLPELLLQAYDNKVDRGAPSAIKLIAERAGVTPLLLRILESLPLPARTRTRCFDSIFEEWRSRLAHPLGQGVAGIPPSEFSSLLATHPDSRDGVVAAYLSDEGACDYRDVFAVGWAGVELAGHADRFRDSWQSVVSDCIDRRGGTHEDNPIVRNWLCSIGASIDRPLKPTESIVVATGSTDFPGAVWRALARISLSGDTTVYTYERAMFARLVDGANSGPVIPRKARTALQGALKTSRLPRRNVPSHTPDSTADVDREYLGAVMFLAAAFEESSIELTDYESLLGPYPLPVMCEILLRRSALSNEDPPELASAYLETDFPAALPGWCSPWRLGQHFVVGG